MRKQVILCFLVGCRSKLIVLQSL